MPKKTKKRLQEAFRRRRRRTKTAVSDRWNHYTFKSALASFDRHGYWSWSKRLELGRFEELTGDGKKPLTRTGLLALLEAGDIGCAAPHHSRNGGAVAGQAAIR